MCRLLGYLGLPIQLDQLICQPKHSLIVQSYKPREMAEAVLNADGFGMGWYHSEPETEAFTYRNVQPIWNDVNLPPLCRYIKSEKVLGYVRSATPGQAVSLDNCQPFQYKKLLFIHNGYLQNFRQHFYRSIRNRLSDPIYQHIHGTTDSEHIFALFLNELTSTSNSSLTQALETTLKILGELAEHFAVKILVNVIISDGDQMVACRFASRGVPPSLYWLQDDPNFPQSVIIASEPLFAGKWNTCPEQSIISVGENLDIQIQKLA